MNACQHGKAIVKFCLFEHCQSKQTAGCDDCIKKYHNHIGQISFLSEDDIKSVVKKFQIESNYRPKSRSLQESIFNFFTHVKTNISLNLDLVCKSLINQIGYPYLQKNGTLNCYKRLKNKQYRKVSQKELKQLWDLFKNTDSNEVFKEEKRIYNQAVVRIEETLDKMEKNIKEVFQNLSLTISQAKSNLSTYDRTLYLKINDIFKEIKKFPIIANQKSQDVKLVKKETLKVEQKQSQRKKPSRDVSLDRQIKIENNLKTISKVKTEQTERQEINNAKQNKEKVINKEGRDGSIMGKNEGIENVVKKENDKLTKSKKVQKYSVELKPEQMNIRLPQKNEKSNSSFVQYSEKQEEILERKRKLMELMNSKPANKKSGIQQNEKQKIATPITDRQANQRTSLAEHLKNDLSEVRLNMPNIDTPTKNFMRVQKQDEPIPSADKQAIIAKKQKMNQLPVEDQQADVGSKKSTRNETVMSSETQTEQLFHANVHIPIDDSKKEEEQHINVEQSVQKCIVVPQVEILARGILSMHNECQSPLMIKKKEIQKFSELIKLAQSKFIEEQENKQAKSQVKEEESSAVRLNNILNDENKETQKQSLPKQKVTTEKNEILGSKKNLSRSDSVQINESQQQSLALLLKSLKLPATQAIPYLQKSLQISSNNLSAAEYLSYLYLQAQKPQECLKLCNDILKFISSSQSSDLALRLNINKSAALNHLGRYSECITFLERCLRYRHNDLLYKNLADAYYSIGILQKAIYNYEHAIIQNPANTEAHYNLSVCHYQQENFFNASIYIDKALKHQATNEVYLEMKRYIDQKIIAHGVL